ncbi:MAG TPA: hypothetical protein VFF11_11835, partial [Candidatus Binatia bacterium]|nr:hypothetical protein [Candidatus Binatia bacterium]
MQVNPTQTDPVTGAPIIQPVPPVKVIGGFPPPTKVSLDNLSDGGTTGRTKQTELINNTVMRVNDGTNIRTASQITGVVHSTSGAGAGVIDNAAVIHSRPEGIGTTVQKLNSSGLLVDADQVAADGATFDRHQHDSHFENILQNGDATNGTLHWFSSGTGGATTVSEADPWGTIRNVIRSGTCSSFDLLNNPGTNSGGAGEIRITPGDTYVYDFWCKTGGTGTWKLFNTNTAGGTSIQTIGAPTGWTHVVAQFTFPTTGTIFYSTGLSLVNTSATADTIDVCAATIRKVRGLDNDVADGTTHVRLRASHASNNVAYNFQGAWNSVANYVVADEVTFGNIYWIALANNTNSQSAVGNANWQAVGRIQGDLQIFTASGTWNKPAAGTFAVITCIGGGGAGGSGAAAASGTAGGGGKGAPGGFSFQILPLSVLGATESVVVGGGGTPTGLGGNPGG